MDKKLLTILSVIFISNSIFSQIIDTTYYDKNWNETNLKDSICFIGTKQKLNDSVIIIKDYYINGNIQNSGQYTNNERTGRWKYYYPDGKLIKDYEYLKNGRRRWYHFDEEILKPNDEGIYHTINFENFAVLEDTTMSLSDYVRNHFNLPKRAIKKNVINFKVHYKLIIGIHPTNQVLANLKNMI